MYKTVISLIDNQGIYEQKLITKNVRESPSTFSHTLIKQLLNLKSATTRLYDTEAKIICIVSKKGAQCIECHHKDI